MRLIPYLLIAIHRYIKFWRVNLSNRELRPVLQKLGVSNAYTRTAGKVEASLQLAYLPNTTRLQFIDGKDWAVGLYSKGIDGNGSQMTVFMRKLQNQSPHFYFDYKPNNSILRLDFPTHMSVSQLVTYDGFISSRFNLYAPNDYKIDSLVVGAPDVLDAIDQHHLGADIELLGNQLYYIFPKKIRLAKKLESLIEHSEQLAIAIDDNLSRYVDSRAPYNSKKISYQGKRLIKR